MSAPTPPPQLELERVLTPGRSWVARIRGTGARVVVRLCRTPRSRLERRRARLASVPSAHLVVETQLLEHEGHTWSLRPWVGGRALRDIARDPQARASLHPVELAYDIARAAAALHARGAHHGRLHAGNVIVRENGGFMLVDALDLHPVADPSLAPEILRGEPGSARSDVYGLSLLLVEACTGEPPFGGGDALESARRALFEVPDLVDAVAGGVPQDLVPLLQRSLARKPWRRHPHLGAWLEAVGATDAADPAEPEADRPAEPIFDRLSAAAARALRWRPRPAALRVAAVPALGIAAALGALLLWEPASTELEDEIGALIEAKDLSGASQRLGDARRRGIDEAVAEKLQGDLSCAKGEHARCLAHYQAALDRDDRFASDERLVRNTLALLERNDLAGAVRDVAAQLEGVEDELLEQTRNEHYWRRWNAARALEARGLSDRIDWATVYGLDVLHAGTCSTRRASLSRLVALKDENALPYLERARKSANRGLFGDWCLGSDLDRAIRAIRPGS